MEYFNNSRQNVNKPYNFTFKNLSLTWVRPIMYLAVITILPKPKVLKRRKKVLSGSAT